MLLPSVDGSVILKSYRDGKNLQVRRDNTVDCNNQNEQLWEWFDIEMEPGQPNACYFVSRHTNKVIQCSPTGAAITDNTNRKGWEKMIIEKCYPDPKGFKIQPRLI